MGAHPGFRAIEVDFLGGETGADEGDVAEEVAFGEIDYSSAEQVSPAITNPPTTAPNTASNSAARCSRSPNRPHRMTAW